MQASELRTRVMTRMSVPSSGDGIATPTNILDWLNMALRVVAEERDWPWLLVELFPFVITDGVGTLPTNAGRVFGMSIGGYPIQAISKSEYLAQNIIDLPSPYGFVILGDSLKLVPLISGALEATLIYYRTEVTLAADADEPLLPAAQCDALIDYAAYLGYLAKQDTTRAAPALASYQAWVKRMQADESPLHKRKRIRQIEDGGTLSGPFSSQPISVTPSFAAGLIVCTSSTHPTGVDGQVIFETDTRNFLVYDSSVSEWVAPKQMLNPSILDLTDIIAL